MKRARKKCMATRAIGGVGESGATPRAFYVPLYYLNYGVKYETTTDFHNPYRTF